MYEELYHESILDYTRRNPRDITYIGIGSSPRYTNLAQFTPELDQIFPEFMMNIVNNTHDTIRVIHYDPMFKNTIDFLHTYFQHKNLSLGYSGDEMHTWLSEDHRIEIIICIVNFNWSSIIFEELVNVYLQSESKLIVQAYTGNELIPVAQQIYLNTNNKIKFKNNILFDITYGKDCHCSTDMTKYAPFYDKNNNFINIILLKENEMINIINTNIEIDNIIKTYFIKQYNKIINLQTDYRRKILGCTILFPNNGYTDESTLSEIMNIIFNKLNPYILILKKLNVITNEKQVLLNHIYHNYDKMDMHKVYVDLASIVK